jgi:hypothetical protein
MPDDTAKTAINVAMIGSIALPPLTQIAALTEPALANWLFGPPGPKQQQIAQRASDIVQAVTGTSDPAAAKQTLDADGAKRDQLRLQLLQISAQADNDQRASEAARRNGGRSMIASIQAGSMMSRGPAVISMLVLAGFGIAEVLAMRGGLPDNSVVLNSLIDTVKIMSVAVVTYWVGSSTGSAQKTSHIMQLNDYARNSVSNEIVQHLVPPATGALAAQGGVAGNRAAS